MSSTGSVGNLNNREWGTVSATNYIKGLYRFGVSGIFHYGMRGNLCGACSKHCGGRQSSQRTYGRWQPIPLFVFQPIQDRFPIEINTWNAH